MTDAPERIVAAAVYFGAAITLPPPARHHTILQTLSLEMHLDEMVYSQGFMTSTGRYVNRVEAYYIAFAAGQLESKDQPRLFSEDLW